MTIYLGYSTSFLNILFLSDKKILLVLIFQVSSLFHIKFKSLNFNITAEHYDKLTFSSGKTYLF